MLGHRAIREGALLCGALVCVACASDSNSSDSADKEAAPARAELKCHAAVIEPDMESEFIAGSAVDLGSGELQLDDGGGKQYVVSSTYGIPKRGADGEYLSPRYQMLMGMIVQTLQTQPGLLALQVSSSDSCKSGRTLAVWESEELMYDFVTTGPHLEAMSSAEELLEPGYAVTHWTASSPDQMTLMAAPEHLKEYFE